MQYCGRYIRGAVDTDMDMAADLSASEPPQALKEKRGPGRPRKVGRRRPNKHWRRHKSRARHRPKNTTADVGDMWSNISSLPAEYTAEIVVMNSQEVPEEIPNLEKVRDDVLTHLPTSVIAVVKDNALHVGFWASSLCLIIQRSLHFFPSGFVTVDVHGKELPPEHTFWNGVKTVPLSEESLQDFCRNVVQITNGVRQLEVCKGVEDFEPLWKHAAGTYIDYNPFQEGRYQKTCRSDDCLLLVEGLKLKTCTACTAKWGELNHLQVFIAKEPLATPPTKNKATPEKNKGMQTYSKKIKSQQEANKTLRQRISKLLDEERLRVNEELSSIHNEIMEAIGHPDDNPTDMQENITIKDELE